MSDHPTLLPPNATPLERDLEVAAARLADLPAERVRDIWDPEACPADLLPWLAHALGVDEWQHEWPEATRRAVCAAAAEVHRRKGTVGAVRRVLGALGVDADITEWWQTDPSGTPHTFGVRVGVGQDLGGEIILGPAVHDAIHRGLDAAKPVRSHADVTVYALFEGAAAIGSADLRLAKRQAARVEPIRAPLALDSAAAIGSADMRLTKRQVARVEPIRAPLALDSAPLVCGSVLTTRRIHYAEVTL